MNQKEVNSQPYEPFFEGEELKKIVMKVRFLRGENVDLTGCFNEGEVREINNKKQLEIRGKTVFQDGDEVILTVTLKNIQQLSVRVFEVNTENFLNQTPEGENYEDINVDVMVPQEEFLHQFNQPARLVH